MTKETIIIALSPLLAFFVPVAGGAAGGGILYLLTWAGFLP